MDLAVRGGRKVRAGTVFGLVGNFADHRREMQHAPGPADVVDFFLKPAGCLLPGGGTVRLPAEAGRVEHEIELAVVMGRRADRVAPADALRHVLGYAPFLDLTAREVQARAKQAGTPWARAKGFATFGPIGRIAPRASVPDPQDLEMLLEVNGQPRQRGSTAQMLVPVAGVVSQLSHVVPLEPGDVIATGTPAGVGPIVADDALRAEIPGVGVLECTVAQG